LDRKPESIELEIADQRRRIEEKVRGIRGRVNNDIATLETSALERASAALDEVGHLVNLETPMREHPYTTMAAGFGLGAALGAFTDGGQDDGSSSWSPDGRRSSSQDGGGLMGFVGSLVGLSADMLQAEVRDYLREAISNMFSNKRRNGYDVA